MGKRKSQCPARPHHHHQILLHHLQCPRQPPPLASSPQPPPPASPSARRNRRRLRLPATSACTAASSSPVPGNRRCFPCPRQPPPPLDSSPGITAAACLVSPTTVDAFPVRARQPPPPPASSSMPRSPTLVPHFPASVRPYPTTALQRGADGEDFRFLGEAVLEMEEQFASLSRYTTRAVAQLLMVSLTRPLHPSSAAARLSSSCRVIYD
jgi:hypothetical protein